MTKFRGAYMTKEQYINWLIQNIQVNAKHFAEAHYPELKQEFANMIYDDQNELVELGYTWEQVEQIEFDAYKAA